MFYKVYVCVPYVNEGTIIKKKPWDKFTFVALFSNAPNKQSRANSSTLG